jgi:hypothetical protein
MTPRRLVYFTNVSEEPACSIWRVEDYFHGPVFPCTVQDIRLPPKCRWGPHSCRLLRSVYCVDGCLATFRDSLSVPSWRVKQSKKNGLTLQDSTDRVFRKVVQQPLTYAAYQPRRARTFLFTFTIFDTTIYPSSFVTNVLVLLVPRVITSCWSGLGRLRWNTFYLWTRRTWTAVILVKLNSQTDLTTVESCYSRQCFYWNIKMGHSVVKVWPGLDCPSIGSAGRFSFSWWLTSWFHTSGNFLDGLRKCEVLKKNILLWT